MTSFERLHFTKTWALTKYATYCENLSGTDKWKVKQNLKSMMINSFFLNQISNTFFSYQEINRNELGGPIIACLTPTNFLTVKSENEVYVRLFHVI